MIAARSVDAREHDLRSDQMARLQPASGPLGQRERKACGSAGLSDDDASLVDRAAHVSEDEDLDPGLESAAARAGHRDADPTGWAHPDAVRRDLQRAARQGGRCGELVQRGDRERLLGARRAGVGNPAIISREADLRDVVGPRNRHAALTIVVAEGQIDRSTGPARSVIAPVAVRPLARTAHAHGPPAGLRGSRRTTRSRCSPDRRPAPRRLATARRPSGEGWRLPLAKPRGPPPPTPSFLCRDRRARRRPDGCHFEPRSTPPAARR